MSEAIGDRILTLADDYRQAGKRQDLGSEADAWDTLCNEVAKVDACEDIARACLARHKAAERVRRWQPLYRAAVRCKGTIGGRREWRHVRIAGKLTQAMDVCERLEDAELKAVTQWGGKL